ncbi:MAG: radical SAM protein [Nitrospirae bacterium]|nr:MAG: radical SAM protein [Nitrospirota bacterium]
MLRVSGFNDRFYLQWHITDACNLSCAHCYNDALKEEPDRKILSSVLENFKRFLDRNRLKGRIHLCGGEPFLSKHLHYLLAEISKSSIPFRILSNGTLMTPDIAKELKRYACDAVQISVEGSGPIHDSLRGVSSFSKAMTGASLLEENGVPVTFMMTVSRKNAACIEDVAGLAAGRAKRFAFSRLVPIGPGSGMSGDVLKPVETKRLFKSFHSLKKKKKFEVPVRDPLWHAYFNKCNPHLVSGCSIGYNGICVDTDGSVYPCRRLPLSIGNACKDDLNEIWNSPLLEALRDRDRLKGKCGRCRLRWQCGGCRAIANAVSGDYLAEDPQCFT